VRRDALPLAPLAIAILLACSPKSPPRTEPDNPFALPGEGEPRPGVIHEVQRGESWRDLAEAYYERPRRARELRRANPALGDTLRPGQSVFVPLDEAERRAFARRAPARAPYNRGLERARAGDLPGAILQFQAAIRLDPDFALAHYNLGLAYRRSGRPELAAAPLARAVSLRPDRAGFHYAEGANLIDLGEKRRAERVFRDALRRDDEHVPSLYALASLLDERGRRREGARLWRRLLRAEPDGPRAEEARRRLGGGP
jgi:tetratricopeptide (TPR) repeat protein